MNDILGDLLDHCTVAYIDNILIYSDSLEQHQEHVREILRCLRKNGLYAKASKCEWHKDSFKFLGYILRTKGLTMAEDKVKTIWEWPELRKSKTSSLSLDLPTSTIILSSTIWTTYPADMKRHTLV